jgi:phosphatidate cytidylyltransferase
VTRVISGLVLAAAAVAAILFLPLLALRVVTCVIAMLAAHEYLRVVGSTTRIPTLIVVALTCWFVPMPGDANLLRLLLLSFAVLAFEVLFQGAAIHEASARFLAPWYIGVPLGMLVAVQGAGGAAATLLLLGTVVVSDSSQYYTGRAFGRRPLAPAISPKKTIEGAIGGVVFGALFLVLAGRRVLGAAPTSLALLGLAVVVLGICGDLFESRLKRASGLKDSSALIPGHGGVLDRIDALLFATPAFYFFLRG